MRAVYGGGGDDVIYGNPNVTSVYGGAGDDVIHGELLASQYPEARASASGETIDCGATAPSSCYGGSGDQVLDGGPGDDTIFGERGNDTLNGNGGNDALYGGVGDDGKGPGPVPGVNGGDGNDLVSGGLGADIVRGDSGDDLVRGDGTIDEILGGTGNDTLSFATAVTPGFGGAVTNGSGTTVAGFPTAQIGEERGVYVRLDGTNAACGFSACNNNARYGGGNDTVDAASFENVIGSPFADYIVGSSGANVIDGGGGSDVIRAQGGDDTIYGGADGDYVEGGDGADQAFGQAGADNCASDIEIRNDCLTSDPTVVQRDRTTIAVGSTLTNPNWVELYLTGSDTQRDHVNVSYNAGSPAHVVFSAFQDSASFDLSGDGFSANCNYSRWAVDCTLPRPLDAIVLAGMGGNDELTINSFPELTSPILLGGAGGETLLQGGETTEDLIVDGPGVSEDRLKGLSRDDGLINNEGTDTLQGGLGNDLVVSASLCDGDSLDGGGGGVSDPGVNNASWAQLATSGVIADLAVPQGNGTYRGLAGNQYQGGPSCGTGTLDSLYNFLALEGSGQNDLLFGDAGDNTILGRIGQDGLYGRDGADLLLAQDGQADNPVDCGDGVGDQAFVDAYQDTYLNRGCESISGPGVPTPAFSFTCSETSCSFDASGSSDSDGTIQSYGWDFGDGTTATGVTAAHTYAGAGSYTVTLTVIDNGGAGASSSQLVSIAGSTPPPPPPPNAAPTASFSSSCSGLSCSFDASGSSDSDGTIQSYGWDFGDGRTASGVTATHTYAKVGTYTVQLTVTDDDGALAVATGAISPRSPIPQTTIRFGPERITTRHRATFRFRSSLAGSMFRCKLDRQLFSRCRSPRTYRHLTLGRHVFWLQAIGPGGYRDPTPARRAWRIVRRR